MQGRFVFDCVGLKHFEGQRRWEKLLFGQSQDHTQIWKELRRNQVYERILSRQVNYYRLEFRVESPAFWRHKVAVRCARDGRLYTLNAQTPESAWPIVKTDSYRIADSSASPGALSNVLTEEHEVILCAIGFKSTQAILHYCGNKLKLLFILNSSAGSVKKRRKTLRPEELEFQDHLLKRVNSLQFNINQTEMT